MFMSFVIFYDKFNSYEENCKILQGYYVHNELGFVCLFVCLFVFYVLWQHHKRSGKAEFDIFITF